MKRMGFTLLLAGAVVLVVAVRGAWQSRPDIDAILAESERVADRLLAGHLAQDGRRPTLGEPIPDLDARAVYADVLPLFGALSREEGATLRWVHLREFGEDQPAPEAIDAVLAKTGPFLERLRPALRAPRMSPVDPWTGPEPDWSDLGHLLAFSRVASSHVHAQRRAGQSDAAIDLSVLRWFVGLDGARRGRYVNALVGRALARISAQEIGWILAHAHVGTERLARLARELDTLRAATPARESAWRIEEYWDRRHLGSTQASERAFLPATTSSYFGRRLYADMLVGLRPTWKRMEDAFRGKSVSAGVAEGNRIVKALRDQGRTVLSVYFAHHPGVYDRCRETDMHTELLRVTVALARYRAEHGRNPDRLTDLVPAFLTELPTCPYSGQPFRHADGRVWSVGGDGDDDGGFPVGLTEELAEEGDVVYTLRTRALQTFAWPASVDAHARATVEEALRDASTGGAAAERARKRLVALDIDVCGRLISEFKRVEEGVGFDTPKGRAQAGALDVILRSYDGVMDDDWRESRTIRPDSDPAFVRTIALRWTNWWRSGAWWSDPREPVERSD